MNTPDQPYHFGPQNPDQGVPESRFVSVNPAIPPSVGHAALEGVENDPSPAPTIERGYRHPITKENTYVMSDGTHKPASHFRPPVPETVEFGPQGTPPVTTERPAPRRVYLPPTESQDVVEVEENPRDALFKGFGKRSTTPEPPTISPSYRRQMPIVED